MAFFICKSNSFTVLLPEPLQCFPNIDNSVGILWSDKDPGDNLSLKGEVDLFSRVDVLLEEVDLGACHVMGGVNDGNCSHFMLNHPCCHE